MINVMKPNVKMKSIITIDKGALLTFRVFMGVDTNCMQKPTIVCTASLFLIFGIFWLLTKYG